MAMELPLRPEVDIVDFNGSFLARVRDLAGANPIILVITKVDLLPKETDLNCVGDWVVEAINKKKLRKGCIHSGLGERGKSVSTNALLSKLFMSPCIHHAVDGFGLAFFNIVGARSNLMFRVLLLSFWAGDFERSLNVSFIVIIPKKERLLKIGDWAASTSLGGSIYKIIYEVLSNGLKRDLDETISSSQMFLASKAYCIRKGFVPMHLLAFRNCMIPLESIFIIGKLQLFTRKISLLLLKVASGQAFPVLPETCLTFYGPKALQIHISTTEGSDEFYQKELGVLLTPPTGKEKAEGWMGLGTKRHLQIKYEDIERPTCDVAISGLGWFSIVPVNKSAGISNPVCEVTAGA
ncbi:Nitric oxide synthase, brain [Datura stramonium]|uniref:Nitric oxide synthase, brain n=1 Tax=Datura stramonium TaxID=4076 RepID=A0ABS8STF8_DATST|nr:Nitric oxide synthase, brain [Datura stramonium]